ncbi:MAG: histidinol dehydrogenase [Woeseiaceae bacterium]
MPASPIVEIVEIHLWSELAIAERKRILERSAVLTDASMQRTVQDILSQVRDGGDRALMELTRRFDGVAIDRLRVSDAEFADAEEQLSAASMAAIELSIKNVRRFHEPQRSVGYTLETMPGIRCERVPRPVDCVGLYVPAGSAPLPSTAIMLAVPAAVAGCRRRVLCTPPRADGRADAAVLTAARRGGVTEVYKIGGAQAIAAMAYGTETVPKVDKIFGPGNAWVTAAKSRVAADPDGPAIDMLAGPSEVLVIADAEADAGFVAADLLSQAEHGKDSQALLVATDEGLARNVAEQLTAQLTLLRRRPIAAAALEKSRFIIATDIAEAVEISNAYAPEHLILHIANPRGVLPLIRSAGSVFLGPWSPESAGDYCSGTNHVLPTSGQARSFSGLSVDHFMRQMTVQELSEDGLRSIATAVIELAQLEGLDAHAAAVSRRIRAHAAPGDRR